jgi:hypothetical protein
VYCCFFFLFVLNKFSFLLVFFVFCLFFFFAFLKNEIN